MNIMKYIISILFLIVSCTESRQSVLKIGNKVIPEQITNLDLQKNQMSIEVNCNEFNNKKIYYPDSMVDNEME